MQLKNPSGTLKNPLSPVLLTPLSVSTGVQGSPSVVRFHKSIGGTPLGPHPSVAPARLEARCLVVPNKNHVRVGTLEVPPSTSRTSHPSRLSPEVVLHVEHSQKRSVAAWPASSCSRVRADKRVDFDSSLPCRRKHCAIVQLRLLDPVPPWSGECAATDSHTSRIFRSTSQRCLLSE